MFILALFEYIFFETSKRNYQIQRKLENFKAILVEIPTSKLNYQSLFD